MLSSNVFFILSLLFFERGDEIVNLLFLLVENFVFLRVIVVFFVIHIRRNLFNVSLISIDDLSGFSKLLFELLDLLVLRLDAVHESLTSFREG